jgi:actin-like ATPase involved in cell morphogenesis
MWTYDTNKVVEILGSYILAWIEGVELEDEVKSKMKETLLPYETSITQNSINSIFGSLINKRIESIDNALEKLKQEQE